MQLDELNMIETILSVFLGGALSVITTLLQNKHQRNSELLKDKLGSLPICGEKIGLSTFKNKNVRV